MDDPILTIEEREAINGGRWFSSLSPSLRHDILRCAFVKRFKDGELLCGYTMSFTADRDGFFILPADVRGNNIRVYVLRVSCQEVQVGPAADELARRALDAA